MRRLIALSAFISLFATTSFVATNSIESSMFSSYKEFSGLFAKKGGKHKGNSNNGKGNDNDYGYGEGEQKCGDGRINQVSEECEKDAECNDDDKECKDCKCVDKPKEKQCNDPSARKGSLWIEGGWTCNNNGKGGTINIHMKGKDVKELYGRESYIYNYKHYKAPKRKRSGVECKKGRLKTRNSFSGIDKSDVYMRIEPKSYKRDGCYQKIKKWSFNGEYNGKEFEIEKPSNCFLKTTKSGRSGKIYCYDLELDIEEEEEDEDDEDEDEDEDEDDEDEDEDEDGDGKYNKKYSQCVAQGNGNKGSDCTSCLKVNCNLMDKTAWKDCVRADKCHESTDDDDDKSDYAKCVAQGKDNKKSACTGCLKSFCNMDSDTSSWKSCVEFNKCHEGTDDEDKNKDEDKYDDDDEEEDDDEDDDDKDEDDDDEDDEDDVKKKYKKCTEDGRNNRNTKCLACLQSTCISYRHDKKRSWWACVEYQSCDEDDDEEEEEEEGDDDDDDEDEDDSDDDEDKDKDDDNDDDSDYEEDDDDDDSDYEEDDDDDDEDKDKKDKKKKDKKKKKIKKDKKKKDKKKKGWDEDEEEDEDIYQIDTSVYYILDKKDSKEKKEKKFKTSAPEKKEEKKEKKEKKKKKKIKKDKGPLGCFNANGKWTNNRSNCDKNQRKHYQKVVEKDVSETKEDIPDVVVKTIKKEKAPKKYSEAEERIIKDKLKKKYSNSDKFMKKRKKLLKSIKKTQKKIITLRKTKDLAQQVDSFFLTSLNWLETQHNYVQDRKIDSSELSVISDYIKKLVISIEDLLKGMPKNNGSVSNVKIDGLFSRVAVLIDKFPQIVSALWQVGIDVDENTVGDYFEMRNNFLKLWDECKADTSVCADLEGILDKYEDIKEALEAQINKSGNNNAKDIVRKMLEA